MSSSGHPYEMTLSLNILRHLGLGLYSNIAAVLSEVVANSWDADAEQVDVKIDASGGRVTIRDDGHGMTIDDANQRYLLVGYARRAAQGTTPRLKRRVMGRKGIGKLSLFSIARTVEVHTVRGGTKHGFIMDSDDIEALILDGKEAQYYPRPVDPDTIKIDSGTSIVLTNMKRQLQWTVGPLRRRLARRFSIIGPQHRFEISLNGQPIAIADRDYSNKIQYVWTFGPIGQQNRDNAPRLVQAEERSGTIQEHPSLAIDGWVATAFTAGQLRDSDTSESINKILVMVRGKLAQEDILEEFGEGGLYTKYVFGEIHADFLDLDDQDDIATTSRQKLIEEDPRYRALKDKLRIELKHIQNSWTEFRNQEGKERAFAFPQIEEWFKDLDADQSKAAERLFGRINRLPIDDENQKRQLFVSGILAFESLKLRRMLHKLDSVSAENLGMLNEVFLQLDDLEASAYYQIVNDRLKVIRKLTGLVDENAKERALQQHLYKHLWLLDPSWERATHTEHMETNIHKALQGVYESLTEEQQRARLDIYYSTTGNRHVIIELKRANRVLTTTDLHGQISKYYSAAERVLTDSGKRNEPLEIVCVVGKPLRDWSDSTTGEERSRDSLRALNARLQTYDELIENALQAYQDYVDSGHEAGRVYRLVQGISEQDVEAISPESRSAPDLPEGA